MTSDEYRSNLEMVVGLFHDLLGALPEAVAEDMLKEAHRAAAEDDLIYVAGHLWAIEVVQITQSVRKRMREFCAGGGGIYIRDELSLYTTKAIHRTDIPARTDLGSLPRYNSPENKRTLYGQQEGNCEGCRSHFEARHLEVAHIIARTKGGTNHLGNLQLLCASCNRIKGDRGMAYLRTKLQLV